MTDIKLQLLNLGSEVKSLRTLDRAVFELSRLYDTLTEEHHKNSEAMEYLTGFFVAFQVEVRSGRLTDSDLRGRRGAVERFRKAAHEGHTDMEKFDKLKFVKATIKYATIDLESELLNDDILSAILVEGRFPEKEIRESIDSSSEFLVPEKDDPWKVVYHLDNLIGLDDDDIVKQAIDNLERQFKNREVTVPGEMFHIFRLRVKLAKDKIIEKTLAIFLPRMIGTLTISQKMIGLNRTTLTETGKRKSGSHMAG